jgi:hypothetical protein
MSPGEVERHHQELEVCVVHLECDLLDVVRVDVHLVVPSVQIQLG